MAEYEVKINHRGVDDSGHYKVTFDLDDSLAYVWPDRNGLVAAIASAIAEVVETVCAVEGATDISSEAKRYYDATSPITLT